MRSPDFFPAREAKSGFLTRLSYALDAHPKLERDSLVPKDRFYLGGDLRVFAAEKMINLIDDRHL